MIKPNQQNAGCFPSPCRLLEIYAKSRGIQARVIMVGRQFILCKKVSRQLGWIWRTLGREIEQAKFKIDQLSTSNYESKGNNREVINRYSDSIKIVRTFRDELYIQRAFARYRGDAKAITSLNSKIAALTHIIQRLEKQPHIEAQYAKAFFGSEASLPEITNSDSELD